MKYTLSFYENLGQGIKGYYLTDGEKEYFALPEESLREFLDRIEVDVYEVENNFNYTKILYRL